MKARGRKYWRGYFSSITASLIVMGAIYGLNSGGVIKVSSDGVLAVLVSYVVSLRAEVNGLDSAIRGEDDE